jgi:hypothetical protein
MQARSVVAAAFLSVASAGAAAACFYRAETLRNEADWLLMRSKAQAAEYSQSFSSKAADQQLKTFAARRATLERAHLWQRGQMLATLLSALAAVATYALFLLKRLDDQLIDAENELGGGRGSGGGGGPDAERDPDDGPRDAQRSVALAPSLSP